ncbi:hypothetical protein MX572_25990 (plasmid) [Rhodococcus pyridinivorans]|uniref:hypothetical protein n=1 Tax=Rhodococcus pyridinivorans TaxID=103816 RepID=UPI0020C6A027|nr:hypothetical protein [Rhodococcus pyridinivorans]UTM40101.1 hypothetical protein MX572_25990 [Rhodococcus pyridinivorans]
MDRVERLVVQVAESNDLLKRGGAARWRISLMLLDNTVELLLKIECDKLLRGNDLSLKYLDHIEALIASGREYTDPTPFDDGGDPKPLTEIRDRYRRETLPADAIPKLENDFNRRVGYLITTGFLDNNYGGVLKRLHKYRNEAYHEDKIRPNTIEAAAKIYTFVACNLMERVKPGGWSMAGRGDLPDLRALFPDIEVASHSFAAPYARPLLTQSPVGTPEELGRTLSEHLAERLDEIDSDLEYLATGGAPWAETDIQTRSNTLDKIVHIHNAMAAANGTKKLNADYRRISQWRSAASKLAIGTDYVKSFDRFASLEIAIEQVEDPLRSAVFALDGHLEDERERARWGND